MRSGTQSADIALLVFFGYRCSPIYVRLREGKTLAP